MGCNSCGRASVPRPCALLCAASGRIGLQLVRCTECCVLNGEVVETIAGQFSRSTPSVHTIGKMVYVPASPLSSVILSSPKLMSP
jgi:hypothetical protein